MHPSLWSLDLPSRNDVKQEYCVIAFSVIHEVGSLARALKAFEVSMKRLTAILLIKVHD